jgi:hypothetical protein
MRTYAEFLNLEFNGFELEVHDYQESDDYYYACSIDNTLGDLYLVFLW